VAITKKQRSLTTGKLVGSRFQIELLEAIDQWRRRQPDLPTRPEAVCRLVLMGMCDKSINPEYAIDCSDGSSQRTGA